MKTILYIHNIHIETTFAENEKKNEKNRITSINEEFYQHCFKLNSNADRNRPWCDPMKFFKKIFACIALHGDLIEKLTQYTSLNTEILDDI